MIVYGQTIVPTSYVATLNGVDITALFQAAPGSSETVNLPLQAGSNALILAVDGQLGQRTARDRDRLTFSVQ